jgi:hypothetical protein
MAARFTWDPAKARKNRLVHGISFEMAQEVFDGPNRIAADNYFIAGEDERSYQVIGMARNLVLLLVVLVDRGTPGTETIHIIPARKAVDYEASIYQDQFR